MNDLSKRLTTTERDQSHANSRPRDAATLILVDRTGSAPKVLMGRRNPALKFMAGKFVFPGGRLDPADRAMNVYGMFDDRTESALMARVQRPSPNKARSLALAAIRETCEETGLLLGTKDAGAPDSVPKGWELFAQHGVYPSLEALHFVARAITPPRRPRRFDTRFFAADVEAVVHRVDAKIGPDSELTELKWLTLEEASNEDLPTITKVVLEELSARAKAGFSRMLPIPFYKMRNKVFERHEV
jgi:8-oxo-dGTP pyrophosphatase MutT (NUDIX family)